MRRTFFIHRKFQGQNEGFGEKTGFLSGPVSSHPILELNDKLFSRRQGLLDIRQDIVHMLNADGEADHVFADTG